METKTNAAATYATKTALASTDANVASVSTVASEAKSVADDANTKANNCIDNVSITGNVLTFTKTNDEHIDITLPSRTALVTLITDIDVSDQQFSTALGQGPSNIVVASLYYNGTYQDFQGNIFPLCYYETTINPGDSYQSTFDSSLATRVVTKCLENATLNDGSYIMTFACTNAKPGTFYNTSSIGLYHMGSIYCQVTISEGEITSVSQTATRLFFRSIPSTCDFGLTAIYLAGTP